MHACRSTLEDPTDQTTTKTGERAGFGRLTAPATWGADQRSRLIGFSWDAATATSPADNVVRGVPSTNPPFGTMLEIPWSPPFGAPDPASGAPLKDIVPSALDSTCTPGTPQSCMATVRNVDLGLCSLHVPWRAEDKSPDLAPLLDYLKLGDKGIADLILTGFEKAAADLEGKIVKPDVKWLWDGVANVSARGGHPPQVFVRFNANSAQDQVCVRSHWSVDGRIRWFDRRFLPSYVFEPLAQILGLGKCRKNVDMTVQFCGVPRIKSDGTAEFVVNPDDVTVNMEKWRRIRAICNNQVRPKIISAAKEQVRGAATEKFATALNDMFGAASDYVKPKRIEILPSGVEIVLAEKETDPEYGLLKLFEAPSPALQAQLEQKGLGDLTKVIDFHALCRDPKPGPAGASLTKVRPFVRSIMAQNGLLSEPDVK